MKIWKRKAQPDTGHGPETPRKTGHVMSGGAPRWVGWFTDFGRPLSAIVVMILCAPGERHLAELAGWGPDLSWGMAGLLVMYAGIAAVVATVRPSGAPGKRTAVLGAILSLLLAMAAQPVSHYFVTGWMSAEPRPPFWLVTVVSCVPPFVMGHLLHLAADPGGRRIEEIVSDPTGSRTPDTVVEIQADTTALERALSAPDSETTGRSADSVPVPDDDIPWDSAATWHPDMADTDGVVGGHGESLADWAAPVSAVRYENRAAAEIAQDVYERSLRDAQGGQRPPTIGEMWAARTLADGVITDETIADVRAGRLDMDAALEEADRHGGLNEWGHNRTDSPDSIVSSWQAGQAAGQIMADGLASGLSGGQRTADTDGPAGQSADTPGATAKRLWKDHPDMSAADMRAAVRDRFPDMKADTVRKAVKRVEEGMQQ